MLSTLRSTCQTPSRASTSSPSTTTTMTKPHKSATFTSFCLHCRVSISAIAKASILTECLGACTSKLDSQHVLVASGLKKSEINAKHSQHVVVASGLKSELDANHSQHVVLASGLKSETNTKHSKLFVIWWLPCCSSLSDSSVPDDVLHSPLHNALLRALLWECRSMRR